MERVKKANFFFQMLLIVEAINAQFGKKCNSSTRYCSLCSLFPIWPHHYCIPGSKPARLQGKDWTGLKKPCDLVVRTLFQSEGKEGLVSLCLNNNLFLPRGMQKHANSSHYQVQRQEVHTPGTFSGWPWVDVAGWLRLWWSYSWEITTWFYHHRLFWPCLKTKDKHQGKCQVKLLQLFSFIGQYTGNSLLSDLVEERQQKRLKALKQRHQVIENPPLNCRNSKGILHSPLLYFSTGSPVFPSRGIYMLEEQVLVARDTMISSEGSQLPFPAEWHSSCRTWGASAHACKITLFNFLFL